MLTEEAKRVVDSIIWMVCEGHDAKTIAEDLHINEEAVNAVVSRLDITHF